MKNQLAEIKTTLSAIQLNNKEPKTLNDLPRDSQTSLVYAMAKSAHNSKLWWTERYDQAEIDENKEFASSCAQEVYTADQTFQSLCAFLNSLANYVEATNQIIDYDEGNLDSVDKEASQATVKGDVVAKLTGAKSHPYAWARRKLQADNIWPFNEDTPIPKDQTLFSLDGFTRAVENSTAQLIGRWIVALHRNEDFASRRDASLLETATADRRLFFIKWSDKPQEFFKQLFHFIRGQKGKVFLDNNQEPVDFKVLFEAYEDMTYTLEDEILDSEIKQKTRVIKKQIRQSVLMSNTHEQLKEQVAILRAKGATKKDIESLIDPFLDNLTAAQYQSLLKA